MLKKQHEGSADDDLMLLARRMFAVSRRRLLEIRNYFGSEIPCGIP